MFLSKISKTYYLYFNDDFGNRKRVTTRSKTKSDALEFLKTFKQCEDNKKQKLERKSLSEFTKDYLQYSSTIHTVKTHEHCESILREFKRVIGDVPLQSITIRDLETFLGVKAKDGSPWNARRYYIALRSCFEKAVMWNLIPVNPFRSITKPKTPEIVPVYFTEKDFNILLSVVGISMYRDLFNVAFYSGLRLSEILSLTWKDIDFANNTIFVHNSTHFTTKSKRNRMIPMNLELSLILKKRKGLVTTESEFIFHTHNVPLRSKTVSKAFKRYVLRAKINSKLHFHSLRHSFATLLVTKGVSLYAVQNLLGHSSSETTMIYSHLQPQSLHNEVNQITLN